MNKPCIHPIKPEVIIFSRAGFTGPAPPMFFGNNLINVVSHTACLRLVINKLTWAIHVDHVRKSFGKKVGQLKRMKTVPVKLLEEIYVKFILLAVTYGILVCRNYGSSIMDSLNCASESCTGYLLGLKPSKAKLAANFL